MVRHANGCREGDGNELSSLMADDSDAWVKSGAGRSPPFTGGGQGVEGRRRRCCALLPSEKGTGKENGEEGASGGSFPAGGERKGGMAGLARCHVERGSGGGTGARSGRLRVALSEAATHTHDGGGLANRGGWRGTRDTGRRAAGG
jgi:hypothetical protein